MAKPAYDYPTPRTYLFCEMKSQRICTEVCEMCPYIKGCREYEESLNKNSSLFNK